MRTVLFAAAVAVVAVLWLAVQARAGNPVHPVAHPSCHCKARWDHGAYTYPVVWTATDGTKIYGKCRVNPRNGITSCWIVRIG